MPTSAVNSAMQPSGSNETAPPNLQSNESNISPQEEDHLTCDPDDDAAAADCPAPAVNGARAAGAADREAEKARKLAYILSVPPSAIVLSEDGNGETCITHIGTAAYDRTITVEMHRQYCKHHNITVGTARTRDLLEKRIISHIKAGPLKDALASNRRKGSSDRVRPLWCKKDGTILRLINVVTSQSGRPLYLSLKSTLDRSMLDSGVAHPQAYEGLRSLHNTENNEDPNIEYTHNFEELDDRFDPPESQNFEKLSIDELKELLSYIEYWYKKTDQKMHGTSGNNSNYFGDYCKDKDWVFYFYLKMKQLDRTMMSHVASKLPDDVFNESNHAGGTSGTRVPHSGSAGKATSVLAVRGAADAIKERMGDSNRAENVARLETYEDNLAEKLVQKADLDLQYFTMKEERKRDLEDGIDYDDEVEYAALGTKCKAVKKRVVRLQAEIKAIKDKLGYHNEASDDGSYNG